MAVRSSIGRPVVATIALLLAVAGLAIAPPVNAAEPEPTHVLAVSAGQWHTCALRDDGTVACWGSDEAGESDPPDGTFTAVAAGGMHSCAIAADQTLVCWGSDQDNQASPPSGTFKAVAAGGWHNCAIRTDDTLECWGFGGSNRASPPDGTFQAVTAGDSHSCGIRTDGTVACWGVNEEGQASPPRGTFKAISGGGSHTCGIRTDDTLTCWGANYIDQLEAPEGTFSAVAAGGWHSCAVELEDGSIDCWGENDYGEGNPPAGAFTALSAGVEHVCAITAAARINCWGDNDAGQSNPGPTAMVTDLPRWTTSTDVALTWSARPGLSRTIASYDVRYRSARWNSGTFGGWVSLAVATPDTSMTFAAMPGTTYCFEAKARDGDGESSAWSWRSCTATPLDDRALRHGDAWTAGTGAAFYRGTFLRSSVRGATLTRPNIVAERIALLATTCPTCGSVAVALDGRVLATVSLRSETRVDRAIVPVKSWWGAHGGRLTVKVVSSGQKVVIDGVLIRRVR